MKLFVFFCSRLGSFFSIVLSFTVAQSHLTKDYMKLLSENRAITTSFFFFLQVEVENLRTIVKKMRPSQPDLSSSNMVVVQGLETELAKEQKITEKLKETLKSQVELSESQQIQIASELKKIMQLQLALKNSHANYQNLKKELIRKYKELHGVDGKETKILEEFKKIIKLATQKQEIIMTSV